MATLVNTEGASLTQTVAMERQPIGARSCTGRGEGSGQGEETTSSPARVSTDKPSGSDGPTDLVYKCGWKRLLIISEVAAEQETLCTNRGRTAATNRN